MTVIDMSLPLAVILWSIVGLLAVSAAAVIGAAVAPRWRGGMLRNASLHAAAGTRARPAPGSVARAWPAASGTTCHR